MAQRLKKTTKAQYDALLDFLETNRILVTGKTKPFDAKLQNQLWANFALSMQQQEPTKTAEQWKRVYIEWKTYTKRKARLLKEVQHRTGGGESTIKPLNTQEERLLGIISRIHLGDPDVKDTFDYQDQSAANEIHGLGNENVDLQHSRYEVYRDESLYNTQEFPIELMEDTIQEDDLPSPQEQVAEPRGSIITVRSGTVLMSQPISPMARPSNIIPSQPMSPMAGSNNMIVGLPMSPMGSSSAALSEHMSPVAGPSNTHGRTTPKKKPKYFQRQRNNKSKIGPLNLLEEACRNYKMATAQQQEEASMNAQAMNNLATSMNNLAEGVKSIAESVRLYANAKMMKAKVDYYKTFGNLNDFQQ